MTLTATQLIPRRVLFGNPERISPQISPDGTRLAYIAPDDGVLNVWIGEIGSQDFKVVTHDRDRGVRAYALAHDNRHLLYIQDKGGDENWRIYSVDLETAETRDLTPFEGVQAQFVAGDKKFPGEYLIALNKDNPQLHDVYHLDLSSGKLELWVKNPGFVAWVSDRELKVRGAVTSRPDGGQDLLVRDREEDNWRLFIGFPPEDTIGSGPTGFTRDGLAMYLQSSAGANAGRLVRKSIATGAEEVLAEDPTYDVFDVLIHPDTYEPQMVTFNKDRAEYLILDRAIEDDVAAIRKLHPGDFSVVGRDHADRNWIVAFTADDGPIANFAFGRDAREGTFLFDHRPELKKYQLSPREPIVFRARDGLEIHGYLTFPPAIERKDLPTVFWVHGGPWFRDTWGFDPVAQWLANRGYLAVQVNYRGSVGYGKAFVNAGDKEWGGKMHDDLIDAVNWLIEKGYSDPKKIAITGGSYGGFATLVGATFTPDVFCCAVSVVGPSNLKTFIETIPPYWVPLMSLFTTRVGDPDTEEEFLRSRSPLFKVDNIKIPMLIAHGANDPRVKQSESEQIVAAMRQRGIPHRYMLFEDEGHGFAKPENNLKFFGAMEQFLGEHVGGRAEAE